MIVAIAGAHGKIAQLLIPLLLHDGHSVLGLVRNPDHVSDLESLGAQPVVCDLESASADEVTAAIPGADVAIFAAGSGAGSGNERKLTMDRDGAIKLLEAAAGVGAERFLIVSSVGAEAPPDDDSTFSVYLQAKAAADAAVRASDRRWTIVRPGALKDDPATGNARIDTDPYRGEVSRADVAAVIAALVLDDRAAGATLYVNGGDTPITDAITTALEG